MFTIGRLNSWFLLPLVALYISSSVAAFSQSPGDSDGGAIVVKIERCPSYKWLKVLSPKLIGDTVGPFEGYASPTSADTDLRSKCVERLQEVIKSAYPEFTCPDYCHEDPRTPCKKEPLYLPKLATNPDINFDVRLTLVVDREGKRTWDGSASCSFVDPDKIPKARAVCWCGETAQTGFDFTPEL